MVDRESVVRCYKTACEALLDERNHAGHWEGELSTSALSTATAVMALEMVRRQMASGRHEPADAANGRLIPEHNENPGAHASGSPDNVPHAPDALQPLITGGIRWLAEHQNEDGGWGDTVKSFSNISTAMLCRASFHATGNDDNFPEHIQKAVAYIEAAGGVDAVLRRYGKDRTFSIPILTHCALAGLVDWKHVLPLPFYLAVLPPQFYKTVRLPVVSYALPALIAVGQVGFHFRKPRNPLSRFTKWLSIEPTLKRLETIQPANGGFLEATPLTSFVTMSLAGMGRAEHPVAKKGLQFIIDSVRPDGSWPIDTNLATWVTTLSVNALGDDLPEDDRPAIRDWLLKQQYTQVHPYTNADPGGWAWTDLPGGVPDADDTPGTMLALMELKRRHRAGDTEPMKPKPTASPSVPMPRHRLGEEDVPGSLDNAAGSSRSESEIAKSLERAAGWLLDLQNRDGGWPTFCRGWGNLPFDRSAADLTAHAIRALVRWLEPFASRHPWMQYKYAGILPESRHPYARAVVKGFAYLERTQRTDGFWLPLWFGNQYAPDDINPTYGTARVLAAYRDCEMFDTDPARRGLQWLKDHQNDDGGWGGVQGAPSSIEETALAVEILLSAEPDAKITQRGLQWLCDRVEAASFRETTPIGFYFAKLWYFEKLYPVIFLTAALRRACQTTDHQTEPHPQDAHKPESVADSS